MSPELRQGLADWLAWVERGAPEGEPFRRCEGLCRSMQDVAKIYHSHDELKDLFESQGLHRLYPFGEDDFDRRRFEDTQHKCPKRLAWVRAQLSQVSA